MVWTIGWRLCKSPNSHFLSSPLFEVVFTLERFQEKRYNLLPFWLFVYTNPSKTRRENDNF